MQNMCYSYLDPDPLKHETIQTILKNAILLKQGYRNP
jgi:hypothetical protein